MSAPKISFNPSFLFPPVTIIASSHVSRSLSITPDMLTNKITITPLFPKSLTTLASAFVITYRILIDRLVLWSRFQLLFIDSHISRSKIHFLPFVSRKSRFVVTTHLIYYTCKPFINRFRTPKQFFSGHRISSSVQTKRSSYKSQTETNVPRYAESVVSNCFLYSSIDNQTPYSTSVFQ